MSAGRMNFDPRPSHRPPNESPTAVVVPSEDAAGPRQGLLDVFRAEAGRLLRQGGLRGSFITALALGTVAGLASIPVLRHLLDPGESAAAAAVRASDIGVLVVVVTWCLAVALDAAQGSRDGTRVIALVVVPDRRRLLLAHLAAATAAGVAATVVVSLLVGATAGAVLLPDGTDGWAGRLFTGTLASAISTAMLGAMAVCIGLLTRHPGVALVVLIVWWAALPMALTSGGVLLPDGASAFTSALAHFVPSTLGGTTYTGDDSHLTLLVGHLGLAAWTVALLAGTDVSERRRDPV